MLRTLLIRRTFQSSRPSNVNGIHPTNLNGIHPSNPPMGLICVSAMKYKYDKVIATYKRPLTSEEDEQLVRKISAEVSKISDDPSKVLKYLEDTEREFSKK